jgi:co-chaperonin GroES (HSP10)
VYGYFKEGKLMPASGYVFLEELEEQITGIDLRDLIEGSSINIKKYMEQLSDKGGIVTATIGQTVKPKNKARVVAIGKNRTHEPILSIKEGDVIRYDQRYGMKYEIKGKNYIILHQNKIVGKEV